MSEISPKATREALRCFLYIPLFQKFPVGGFYCFLGGVLSYIPRGLSIYTSPFYFIVSSVTGFFGGEGRLYFLCAAICCYHVIGERDMEYFLVSGFLSIYALRWMFFLRGCLGTVWRAMPLYDIIKTIAFTVEFRW